MAGCAPGNGGLEVGRGDEGADFGVQVKAELDLYLSGAWASANRVMIAWRVRRCTASSKVFLARSVTWPPQRSRVTGPVTLAVSCTLRRIVPPSFRPNSPIVSSVFCLLVAANCSREYGVRRFHHFHHRHLVTGTLTPCRPNVKDRTAGRRRQLRPSPGRLPVMPLLQPISLTPALKFPRRARTSGTHLSGDRESSRRPATHTTPSGRPPRTGSPPAQRPLAKTIKKKEPSRRPREQRPPLHEPGPAVDMTGRITRRQVVHGLINHTESGLTSSEIPAQSHCASSGTAQVIATTK